MAFRDLSSKVHFPTLEHKILTLWKDQNVFQRSIEARATENDSSEDNYIFYDGPPFATGLPHYGHLVASTLKDIVPRYWTMRGKKVERRFGWDTHGLPIEMLVEKKLGLSGPTSIQEYGVANFNEACRANVLTYTAEWEQVVTRLGRWVDFENDYKTMDPTFMESVWWVFKQLWDKDFVYQDFRVMPFSWRLSTSLSNFEANSNYKDVQDPAITAKMPLVDSEDVLLIWTTTPWTLPSNLAIAVGTDINYVRATKKDDDTVYIVAEALAKKVLGKKATILETFKGAELVGKQYKPLFNYFTDRLEEGAFHVISSGHVTTTDGTGLVHMAPDFGEDDFNACRAQGINILQSVDDEGNFTSAVADYVGRNIKEADSDIIKHLKNEGRIFNHDTIQHAYPYCERSDTPLIYKAVPARFIRVEKIRDRMVEHNKKIHWVPGAVGHKRFGNWIADARDWNVSRNRFWGTPLPIWKCTDPECGSEQCFGSIAELEKASGETVTDLHPHKIEHLKIACTVCEKPAERISAVFDCWFESGAMPYAQLHYPFENKELFESGFPAQFIAEGLDQTRGWFYTLLILSTALFDRPPFQNVIVNGMVLAEDGSKMSKSKQNYPPPQEVIEELGADALRAYLINSPIVRAEPLRFQKEGVRDIIRTTLLPLINSWSFFTMYANVDGWTPQNGLNVDGQSVFAQPVSDRNELDRWLISMLQSLVSEVNTQMEGYYLYKVVPAVLSFIDHLTNWYIRRSRRRFWGSVNMETAQDKADAYQTLYDCLVDFSKVLAPVLPFLSEAMYQHLVVEMGGAKEGLDSVHLCDFPLVQPELIDTRLESQIALTREVVSLGRALRERHKLKTRQPLAAVTIVHHDDQVRADLEAQAHLLKEELNVKSVRLQASDAELTTVSFQANFKTLGRRCGKQMRDVAKAIAEFTREQWAVLQSGQTVDVLGFDIEEADIVIRRESRGDVVIETQGAMLVALDTELTPALVQEGIVRECIRSIQQFRKDSGLEISDRIHLQMSTTDGSVREAILAFQDKISEEVLANQIEVSETVSGTIVDINGVELGLELL